MWSFVYILDSQPLSCWTRIYLAFANSADPDQLASEEANWSGSTLFAIKYVNYEQISISSNLWLKIRSRCGILIYSAGQALKNTSFV